MRCERGQLAQQQWEKVEQTGASLFALYGSVREGETTVYTLSHMYAFENGGKGGGDRYTHHNVVRQGKLPDIQSHMKM